ncbi:hypothetical protein [Pseudaestuariivita rosea]|uniref:hypothetical protein n=1 Tax=Pseudaestuariivita rosea TaxID=2763263 RepID=UPI001F185A3A|nr:hypothetical protein [Pseudaestuariivita rosea]
MKTGRSRNRLTARLQQKAQQAVDQESASLDAALKTYTADIEKRVKSAQLTIENAIDQFATSMDQKVAAVAKQNAVWAEKAAEASETVHEARMDWLRGSVTLIALPMVIAAISAMVGSLLATAIILSWAMKTPDDLTLQRSSALSSPGGQSTTQTTDFLVHIPSGGIGSKPTLLCATLQGEAS